MAYQLMQPDAIPQEVLDLLNGQRAPAQGEGAFISSSGSGGYFAPTPPPPVQQAPTQAPQQAQQQPSQAGGLSMEQFPEASPLPTVADLYPGQAGWDFLKAKGIDTNRFGPGQVPLRVVGLEQDYYRNLKARQESFTARKAIEAQALAERKQAEIERKNRAEEARNNPFGTGMGTGPATTLTGEDFLKTLPSEMGKQVKALSEGRLQFPGSFALRSPYWQAMISAVSQYDPSFDAANYGSRFATRKAFTSGTEAKSLNALNTVMGHMNDILEAGKELNNTGFPLFNVAKNYVQSQFNPQVKGKLNAFNIARQAVASEMERAYRGVGGSQHDIEEWKKSLDNADSYASMEEAVRRGVMLLKSKIDALGEQYSQGMGTTKQGLELLTPKSRSIALKILGEKPEQGAETPQIPAAARARLSEGKITTFANGQKWTLRNGQPVQVQ